MEHFIGGTVMLFGDPQAILIFALGLVGGMLFGAIPGVNMLTLGAVLLPFTINMGRLARGDAVLRHLLRRRLRRGDHGDPLQHSGRTGKRRPTCFDGYPMTLKGQSGKAIGAAVSCSALGGVASAILMMTATGAIAGWAVRAFGPQEIFALIFFGLAVSASDRRQDVCGRAGCRYSSA